MSMMDDGSDFDRFMDKAEAIAGANLSADGAMVDAAYAAFTDGVGAEEFAQAAQEPEFVASATYSIEDNKLRLYPKHRLDGETYKLVRDAGYIWAPKQELFVAPVWTPHREDVALKLAGEIEDEDISLAERAEQRAERFEQYEASRARDAQSASSAADQISERFWGGQPILVGHHSERRARKDQERMHGLMRKSIKMWETAEYWDSRADGALRHATYKARPDVRFRRLKGLKADLRKVEKGMKHDSALLAIWGIKDLGHDRALQLLNVHDHLSVILPDGGREWSGWSALKDGKITVEEIQAQRLKGLPKGLAHKQRWVDHYTNRIRFEERMIGPDLLAAYSAKPKRAPLAPVVNVDVPGVMHMTSEEWAKRHSDGKYLKKIKAAGEFAAHRVRMFYGSGCKSIQVFIKDKKIVEVPKV